MKKALGKTQDMEARFYKKDGSAVLCGLCPHVCRIPDGKSGLCGVRRNKNGILIAESFGMISALNLDPVEKKPLKRFYPGSKILSAGSYGCNMRCGYCQNCLISQGMPETVYISPEELVSKAKALPGNLGVAFTYNEPLIAPEYILETAPLLKAAGRKTVLVTNGMINPEPLKALLPFIDAMNIDVKGFDGRYYKELGGNLDAVKKALELSAAVCHVEVTTLIVPGKNDSAAEIQALCGWLSSISAEIPLHLARFFPRHEMLSLPPTPVDTLNALAREAEKYMRYVYLGNI